MESTLLSPHGTGKGKTLTNNGYGMLMLASPDQDPSPIATPASSSATGGGGAVRFSFEVFPPRTDKGAAQFHGTVQRLTTLRPSFISVTYGAGGSTRAATRDIVARLVREAPVPAAAHLTCIGAPRQEVDAIAREYHAMGIRRFVALRGDPPEGPGETYVPHPEGYAYASDLVAGLRRIADFDISVGAYPEVHPQAESAAADLDALKRKIDAGAARAITQFFFDPAVFLRFRDRTRAAGIDCPVVPGLLPISNFDKAREFARKCGASVPTALANRFARFTGDAASTRAAALDVACELIDTLLRHGESAFHIYTLNQGRLVEDLCARFGHLPLPQTAN